MTTYQSLRGYFLGTARRDFKGIANRRAWEAIMMSHVVRYPAPSDNHDGIERAFTVIVAD